ncbi:hypothetical protein CHUAL_001672 [Chamberlinius hualienensis]
MELQVSISATSCLESGDDMMGEPTGKARSPVHKMLEVQSLYKPTPPHQPSVKRRRLRLTSVPLVDLRVPHSEGSGDSTDFYGSLNSPPRSLSSDVDASSISSKSGICSVSESMDTPKLGTSSIRIKHLTSSWECESRFPKLNECAHFHYEFVELGPVNVCLLDEAQENSKLLANGALVKGNNFAVQVSSNGKSWVVRRSYENFHMLDQQLHQCIYDRKFSALKEIPKEWSFDDDEQVKSKENIILEFSDYLQRFSDIAGNLINCGPILNWLELDNRGNRLIVTDDSAINTPAVAAAYVTKRYISQAADEISFEVGDMISVIDMPPPEESIWWRGKRGFEVGFFPSECVEVIGDKVPHSIHIPKAPTKPVLRKHGKLIAFFRSFILSRPSRRKLKQSGILKERVFGCDLGEHLLNSGYDIPMVLKCCSEFIEAHGIVDGIYRLSGVTSNIQKLRNTFDEERVPDLNDEAILHDIHCVASLLKMYFRELPNPLLTYQLYDKFVSAVQSDDDVRLINVRDVVQQLPPPHYRTLEFLVRHLSRVAAHGAETGMTPKNVAIVWAPNLLRSKELEIGGVAALQVVGVQAVVTEFLIHYSDLIFNDKMPAFSPCLETTGTPKRSRPKSLAISTPTKLLSLEEARSRALGAIQYNQKYIEVGGGPSMLPNKYHTVIDLPDRKRGSSKHKKSPSGWKSFFSKGKSQQSVRERDKSKSRRKGSTTPSDPGISMSDKAATETDASRNNNRLRSVKSAESLISSAANSQRNSDAIDGVNVNNDAGCEDLLSSSLGAVASAQLRQSPHSHIRSISHDSYFEFSFDRHRADRRPGELATITSEENDEDQEQTVFDDFLRIHGFDQDSVTSATCTTEDLPGSTLNEVSTLGISGIDKLTGSSTPVYMPIHDGVDDSEGKFDPETLQEQSSIESDDNHSDIVGDIQQEVAAALHWDQPSYSHLSSTSIETFSKPENFTLDSQALSSDNTESESKVVAKCKTKEIVVAEVYTPRDSSSEDETGVAYLLMDNIIPSDIDSVKSCSPVALNVVNAIDYESTSVGEQSEFPSNSLAFYDSLEAEQQNLVNETSNVVNDNFTVSEISEAFCQDSLEYSSVINGSSESQGKEAVVDESSSCTVNESELIRESQQESLNDVKTKFIEITTCASADNSLINVSDVILPSEPLDDHCSVKKIVATNAADVSASDSQGIDSLIGVDVGSDSSHAGELSSTSSPGSCHDPFGYSVLINEEEHLSVKDLIQLDVDPSIDEIVKKGVYSDDWVVVDAGKDGIEVKTVSDTTTADCLKVVNLSCNKLESSLNDMVGIELNTWRCSVSDNLPDAECDHFNITPRHSNLFSDKLSPVDESKRKFESEIGRDILRERKLKLELEKIQLEQQKTSPKKLTVGSDEIESQSITREEADVDFKDVELRLQNSALCSVVVEESKRASEPVTSPTKVDAPYPHVNKRHSEPSFKSARPERKASVKELMSKFERKPKAESRASDLVDGNKMNDSSSTKTLSQMKQTPPVEDVVVHNLQSIDKGENVALDIGGSQEIIEFEHSNVALLHSPSEENSLMTMSLEGGLDKQVYDQARRDRIDRYKEERRAQLRERIRSESFREQDSCDYLLRLKQKTTSPVKSTASSDKADDGCGLPVSPRRRARLSAVAYGHSIEDYKPDSYLCRRRSFNAKSSQSSNNLTSSNDLKSTTDRSLKSFDKIKIFKDQDGDGQSFDVSETLVNSMDSSHKLVNSRPKDLQSSKSDQTERTSIHKKNQTEASQSSRIKSPMKERSDNVPIDILSANNEDNKDSRLRHSEKDNPAVNKKSSRVCGPTPPPRKIKDVAALFEPERHTKSQDTRKDEESDQRARSFSRPTSAHIQTRPKTLSSCKEDEGRTFGFSSSSLSTASAVHKVKPKKPNNP